MKLLALESATNLVGAALVSDDTVVERSHAGGRRHAEWLVPAIEEVCADSGVVLSQLDAVAVDVGPGLFTGLRVGVATAKALAQSLGIRLLGVSSLDVLAARAAHLAGPDAPLTVVAVIDARRGEVFVSRYRFAGGDRPGSTDPASVRRSGPELLAPETLARELRTSETGPGERVIVVGDGAVRYLERLAACGPVDLTMADAVACPVPGTLGRLAVDRLQGGWPSVAPSELLPDYRRMADAQVNWEQRTPQAGQPS